MKIGDKVEKIVVWAPMEVLDEEDIFDYFNYNVTESRGCQSGKCNHHSHGAYAPVWELRPDEPLTYLGQTSGESEAGYATRCNYYRMGNTFLCLQEGYHKHDRLTLIDVADIPGELYDDVQDSLSEFPHMPRAKRQLQRRQGRPQRPDYVRRDGTVTVKTRQEVAAWAKLKPEGASDFVNRLLEQEYAKEQRK